MPRNGLTRERVISAAVEWIDEYGAGLFSMRAFAESLNVKTASLYNHIESMDALMAEVCISALRMQRETELLAIEEKTGKEGIVSLANAYREFAKTHRELYHLIMNTAVACTHTLGNISEWIVEPFLMVLADYTLTETEKNHWQRVLRGMVHGFVAQEEAGFFSHLSEDVNDSFQIAIQCYIDGLTQAEKRGN